MIKDALILEILAIIMEIEPGPSQLEGSNFGLKKSFKFFFNIIEQGNSEEQGNIKTHRVIIHKYQDNKFTIKRKEVEVSVTIRCEEIPKANPIHIEEGFTKMEWWYVGPLLRCTRKL